MKGRGWHFEKEVERSLEPIVATPKGTGEALCISSCRNRHPDAIYIQLYI